METENTYLHRPGGSDGMDVYMMLEDIADRENTVPPHPLCLSCVRRCKAHIDPKKCMFDCKKREEK